MNLPWLLRACIVHMSRIMRKPTFCLCENKDADQLRGNREADQRLCFRFIDSTIPLFLNPKFQASSHLLYMHSLVCVGPGQKPERWFSHVAAHMKKIMALSYPLSTHQTERLIRSGRCPSWSESLALHWVRGPNRWFCHTAAHLLYSD